MIYSYALLKNYRSKFLMLTLFFPGLASQSTKSCSGHSHSHHSHRSSHGHSHSHHHGYTPSYTHYVYGSHPQTRSSSRHHHHHNHHHHHHHHHHHSSSGGSSRCRTHSSEAPANAEAWIGHSLDPIGCLFDTLTEASLVPEDGNSSPSHGQFWMKYHCSSSVKP